VSTLDASKPTIAERIRRGDYDNPHALTAWKVGSHKYRLEREMYLTKQREIDAAFKADLLAEHRLTGHPKADLAYRMAEEEGHSEGLEMVAQIFSELAELMTPVCDHPNDSVSLGLCLFSDD